MKEGEIDDETDGTERRWRIMRPDEQNGTECGSEFINEHDESVQEESQDISIRVLSVR